MKMLLSCNLKSNPTLIQLWKTILKEHEKNFIPWTINVYLTACSILNKSLFYLLIFKFLSWRAALRLEFIINLQQIEIKFFLFLEDQSNSRRIKVMKSCCRLWKIYYRYQVSVNTFRLNSSEKLDSFYHGTFDFFSVLLNNIMMLTDDQCL